MVKCQISSVPADELSFGLVGEEALVIRQFFLAGEVLLGDVFFVGHVLREGVIGTFISLWACRCSAIRGSRY